MQWDVSVCGMTRCENKPQRVVTLDNGQHSTTKALCAHCHTLAHDLSDANVVKIVACDEIGE